MQILQLQKQISVQLWRVAIFAERFSGILLEKIGKNSDRLCLRRPDSSASPRFDPTWGSKHRLSHDLTPFRDALQDFYASLRNPARRYGYPGLKIFTSLTLRFQDFQRTFLG